MKKIVMGNFQNGKEKKVQCVLLLSLLLGSFFMLWEYLFGEKLLVFNDIGSDTWQQYVMQYATVVNHLREGNFTLWDFYNGFGTNMLSMNLFDPSLMLLYLLGVLFGTQKMLYFLSWIQVLRIVLAGVVFYRYLSMFSYQTLTKFALAFAYGFNGYLMVWGQHYQFGLVTVYLPLLLLLAEKYLRKEKGRGLFPIMVAVCCIYSIYLTYMSLIAVGVYLIFRIWMMEMHDIRLRVKTFLGGCVQILLGIGMSSGIFLPSAYTMLGVSGRVSGAEMGFFAALKKYICLFPRAYYESVIMRFFSSNLQDTYQLADERYEWYLNYYEDPVLFVSNMVLILAIQMVLVFWRSEETRRVKVAVYTAILMVGLLLSLPVGGYIFNAFQYPSHRHTFVFLPFLFLAAAWMWEYLQRTGKCCVFGLLVTGYVAERVFHLGHDQSVLSLHKTNSLLLAVTSLLMLMLLFVYRIGWKYVSQADHRRYFTFIFMMLIVVNVLSEGKTTYSERVTLLKEDTPKEAVEEQLALYEAELETTDLEQYVLARNWKPQDYFREMYSEDVQEAYAWLEAYDKEFYRVEKDFSSGTIAMDALTQGYCGVSTYNSTLNKNLKVFLNRVCPELFSYDENHVVFWENAQDAELAAFFGVRYLLSKETSLDAASYVLLKQFGEIYLYENVQESSTAHFYESLLSEEEMQQMNSEELRMWYLANTSVKVDALEKHSEVKGTVQAASDGYVMVMIPAEQGWTVMVDGEKQEFLREDLGFLIFEVLEGTHEFVLTFRTEMLTEGIWLSVVCWGIYVVWLIWVRKKQSSDMQ